MRGSFLLLDKPKGITSHNALQRVKRSLGLPKIGHVGTLDPDATGLLIALVGRATKLADYIQDGNKHYTGEILLGVTTSTDDIAGEVLHTSEEIPLFEEVLRQVQTFKGEIRQVPPQVSAVKVDGIRSYALAFQGKKAELSARTVHIYSFDITPISSNRISFDIHCSKGTYIRSLARDLGELLGCGGCIQELRREGSEPFSVNNACPLDEATLDDLQSWEHLFPDARTVSVPADIEGYAKMGNKLLVESFLHEQGHAPHQKLILKNIESDEAFGFARISEDGNPSFELYL